MTLDELRKLSSYSQENKILRFAHTGADGMGIVLNHFGGDGEYDVVSRYNKDGDLIETAILFVLKEDLEEGEEIDMLITETKLEGTVGVDSGQLLIADPSYVLEP
jgi:myosin heavy subunit